MGLGIFGDKFINKRSNWGRLLPTPPLPPVLATAFLEFEGANGSTSIIDSTGLNIWTNNAAGTISTNQFHDGLSSLLLSGNGSISSPATANLNFISDFEWSGWIRPTTATGTNMAICGNALGGGSGNAGLFVAISNGTLIFRNWLNNNTTAFASGVVIDQWQSFKATRVGNTLEIYLNDVKGTSGSTSSSTPTNLPFTIGAVPDDGGFASRYQGYLDTLTLLKS